jgi:hypothetical protein
VFLGEEESRGKYAIYRALPGVQNHDSWRVKRVRSTRFLPRTAVVARDSPEQQHRAHAPVPLVACDRDVPALLGSSRATSWTSSWERRRDGSSTARSPVRWRRLTWEQDRDSRGAHDCTTARGGTATRCPWPSTAAQLNPRGPGWCGRPVGFCVETDCGKS